MQAATVILRYAQDPQSNIAAIRMRIRILNLTSSTLTEDLRKVSRFVIARLGMLFR